MFLSRGRLQKFQTGLQALPEVSLSLLGSVGQFLWDCISQGVLVLPFWSWA